MFDCMLNPGSMKERLDWYFNFNCMLSMMITSTRTHCDSGGASGGMFNK